MFLTGDIERYGTGTVEMYRLMKERDLKPPLISFDEGFQLTIWRPSAATVHDTIHDEELIKRLLLILAGEMSRQKLMERMELKHRPNFME